MAAKESQGLQIALIIFVILTVSLGVTTYLFFDKYQEQVKKFEEANASLVQANQEKDKVAADFATIKIDVVGVAQGDSKDSILKLIEQDRETVYQNQAPSPPPDYRRMVTYLHGSAVAANRNMVKAREEKKQLEKKIVGLEAIKLAQVAEARKEYTDLGAVLLTQNTEFATALVATERSATTSLLKIKSLRNQLEVGVAQFDIDKTKLETEKAELLVVNTKLKKKVDLLNPPPSNLREAAGNVTSVNQGLKIVYINLGYSDGLKKRIHFRVIPNNGQQISEAPVKGHIEVTRVIGSHQAEARILDSEIRNPILKNDRIFSNIWIPGKSDGYALAGFMDIDGDRRSDRSKVKSLIIQNSGSIDAEVDDQGNIHGKIRPGTRFLIVGEYPNKGPEKLKTAFDKFEKQAKDLGVKTIPLQKILDDLGYKGRRKIDKSSSKFRKRSPTRKNAY